MVGGTFGVQNKNGSCPAVPKWDFHLEEDADGVRGLASDSQVSLAVFMEHLSLLSAIQT